MLFIGYPKCTTCKKAKKWLDEHKIEYTDRPIKEENPTAEELRQWHARSGLPLSEDEQYALLATDGMLVKRPLLVGEDLVLTGFKEKEWAEALHVGQ